MKMKRSIDAPPQVGVLYGHHLAVMLPTPVVGAPFFQPAIEHTVEVRAVGDDGHLCRLRQGLEAANQS